MISSGKNCKVCLCKGPRIIFKIVFLNAMWSLKQEKNISGKTGKIQINSLTVLCQEYWLYKMLI